MCFRPATVQANLVCPECGKKVNAVLGTYPDTCPFCETNLNEAIQKLQRSPDSPAPQNGSQPPATPAAPKPPGVLM